MPGRVQVVALQKMDAMSTEFTLRGQRNVWVLEALGGGGGVESRGTVVLTVPLVPRSSRDGKRDARNLRVLRLMDVSVGMDASLHPHSQVFNTNNPPQGIPLYLIMIAGYKIVKKTKQVKPKEADLQACRRGDVLVILAFLRDCVRVVRSSKIALPQVGTFGLGSIIDIVAGEGAEAAIGSDLLGCWANPARRRNYQSASNVRSYLWNSSFFC